MLSISKLQTGMIVWTTDPTFEAINNGKDIRRPAQVYVTVNEKGWFGNGFDHTTKEIDNDANATCRLSRHFNTKEEAMVHYRNHLFNQINNLIDELGAVNA